MTLDEVNTTIYQPQRSDYHLGRWLINRGINLIQSHQLFYYMSKSQVSDIFFSLLIVITKKKKNIRFPKVILERASYPPVTFTGR
jgi:hypothetical protein